MSQPVVLVAIEPPLLADLVRRALPSSVLVATSAEALPPERCVDVAVVDERGGSAPTARHVVTVEDVGEFGALVAALRHLCGVSPSG